MGAEAQNSALEQARIAIERLSAAPPAAVAA
jgi:hypothetical protein